MARRRGQQVSDTTTTASVAAPAAETVTAVPGSSFDEQVAKDLMARARQQGVNLVGPGGLLAGLTKTVLETALEAEMTDHLGYEKHAPRAATAGTPATAPERRRSSPRSA